MFCSHSLPTSSHYLQTACKHPSLLTIIENDTTRYITRASTWCKKTLVLRHHDRSSIFSEKEPIFGLKYWFKKSKFNCYPAGWVYFTHLQLIWVRSDVCKQLSMIMSSFAINVSRAAFSFAMIVSRKWRCLRSHAIMFASSYKYPSDPWWVGETSQSSSGGSDCQGGTQSLVTNESHRAEKLHISRTYRAPWKRHRIMSERSQIRNSVRCTRHLISRWR